MRIAIATAPSYRGPYDIVNQDILPGVRLEDPFLYRRDGQYHIIIEGNTGELTGGFRHGAHLVSDDGVQFRLFEPEPKAYTHTLEWTDGTQTAMDRRERPWLVLHDCTPTHLVTGVLKDGRAWSVVQPLSPEG